MDFVVLWMCCFVAHAGLDSSCWARLNSPHVWWVKTEGSEADFTLCGEKLQQNHLRAEANRVRVWMAAVRGRPARRAHVLSYPDLFMTAGLMSNVRWSPLNTRVASVRRKFQRNLRKPSGPAARITGICLFIYLWMNKNRGREEIDLHVSFLCV